MPTYDGPGGWNIPRDMWENIRTALPRAQSDKLIAAMADYMFTGVEPQGLPQAAQHLFMAYINPLRKFRIACINGTKSNKTKVPVRYRTTYDPREGGSRKVAKANAETPPDTDSESAPETVPDSDSESAPETVPDTDSENGEESGPLPAETLGTGTHQTRHQGQGTTRELEPTNTKDKRLKTKERKKTKERRTAAHEADANPRTQGTEGRGGTPASPASADGLATEEMAALAWEPYAHRRGGAA